MPGGKLNIIRQNDLKTIGCSFSLSLLVFKMNFYIVNTISISECSYSVFL